MLTKFDLRKYKTIKSEMLQLQEQINELAAVMVTPKIPQLSGMPGGGHGDHDKIGAAVARIDKLRSLYYEKLGELADLQLTIETAISQLEHEDQMLIRLYYFSGYTWEQVAVRMNYGWAQIHRKHKAILERLAQDGTATQAEEAQADI